MGPVGGKRLLIWDGIGWSENGRLVPKSKGLKDLVPGDEYEAETRNGLRPMRVQETLSDMGIIIIRSVEIPKGGQLI